MKGLLSQYQALSNNVSAKLGRGIRNGVMRRSDGFFDERFSGGSKLNRELRLLLPQRDAARQTALDRMERWRFAVSGRKGADWSLISYLCSLAVLTFVATVTVALAVASFIAVITGIAASASCRRSLRADCMAKLNENDLTHEHEPRDEPNDFDEEEGVTADGAGNTESSNAAGQGRDTDFEPQTAPTACYDVLGVKPSATREEIESAFREFYHPDLTARLGPELQALATEKTKALNLAHAEALDRIH